MLGYLPFSIHHTHTRTYSFTLVEKCSLPTSSSDDIGHTYRRHLHREISFWNMIWNCFKFWFFSIFTPFVFYRLVSYVGNHFVSVSNISQPTSRKWVNNGIDHFTSVLMEHKISFRFRQNLYESWYILHECSWKTSNLSV